MFQNSEAGEDLYPSSEKTCILVCSTLCLILKTHTESQVAASNSSQIHAVLLLQYRGLS